MGGGLKVRVTIQRFIGDVISLAGVGLMLCAVGIMFIQYLRWIQDGYWTRLRFRLAWELLGQTGEPLAPLGIEKLRTWMLDLPLSLGVFLCGLAAIWFGTFLSDRCGDDKRRLGRADDERSAVRRHN
jgi:hypothetical protein